MNSLFNGVSRFTKNIANKFWGFSKLKRVGIILAFILVFGIFINLTTHKNNNTIISKDAGHIVNVASVSALSQNAIPLQLLGTVTSRSEATIRAESSGKIVDVYKRLGDYVGAGTVIAEFENSSERAQVLQAEGAYEGATAGKSIASIGKDIAIINQGSSNNSLTEVKTQALNILSSTYTGLDDVIRTKTDIAWRNPLTREAKLLVTIADAKLIIELENQRVSIEEMLRSREIKNSKLTIDSDLLLELTIIENEANIVKNYLDDLSLGLNHAIADGNASQASIDIYKANTSNARASVNGILSAITNSRNTLSATLATNKVAEKNSSGIAIDTGSSADAQVKSALGNLRGAQARLEKTIVRSPISGTINSLSVNTGDFVAPFTELAVIANNGALEVVAYVTEDDARELTIGNNVSIGEGASGIITRISPALDPKTRKIEVRIGITNNSASLTNGQSVFVSTMRSQKTVTKFDSIKIPLSALKITPSGAIVFTISASSTLIAHEVVMGALLGDQVVISQGLTSDMKIITDARGLQDGMFVTPTK